MRIETLVIFGVIGVSLWRLLVWLTEAPLTPDPWGPLVDQELENPDAVPICPHCLTPQRHNGWFCPECGATVGQFGNYLPSVYIFSMGDGFRHGITDKVRNRPLLVAGYALVTLAYFSILAPLLWVFLFLNRQRANEEPQPSQPVT